MDTSTGTGRWDVRVLYVERVGRWWWNAWDPIARVEHSGYADTPDDARAALRAVLDAGAP